MYLVFSQLWSGIRDDGRRGRGAVQLPVHLQPSAARAPRPPPRRPIAKFNAKVMRARVRLRAAMQERPAAGGRRAVTHVSASPTTALYTASQFPHRRVPTGHLTNNYSSVKIVASRPPASLAPHLQDARYMTALCSLLAGTFR